MTTTQQLPLPLQHALGYRGEAFIIHSGVIDACRGIEKNTNLKSFVLTTIVGAQLSGKTHCGVWLSRLYAEQGISLSWIDGGVLEESISSLSPTRPIFIDDADRYFNTLAPGFSGPFVRLCESFRHAGQKIFLSFSAPFETLPCDDHIMSRLKAGTLHSLDAPSDEYIPELIDCMARQRGIEITPSRISFLAKRVGRGIEAIDACLERLATEVFTEGQPVVFESIERALAPSDRQSS